MTLGDCQLAVAVGSSRWITIEARRTTLLNNITNEFVADIPKRHRLPSKLQHSLK